MGVYASDFPWTAILLFLGRWAAVEGTKASPSVLAKKKPLIVINILGQCKYISILIITGA